MEGISGVFFFDFFFLFINRLKNLFIILKVANAWSNWIIWQKKLSEVSKESPLWNLVVLDETYVRDPTDAADWIYGLARRIGEGKCICFCSFVQLLLFVFIACILHIHHTRPVFRLWLYIKKSPLWSPLHAIEKRRTLLECYKHHALPMYRLLSFCISVVTTNNNKKKKGHSRAPEKRRTLPEWASLS